MSRESLAIVRAILGLAQGAALYLLYHAAKAEIWPATDGQVFAPLVLTTVFIPILAVVGLGNLRLRSLAIWLAAAIVIVALLGAYDIFHDPAGGVFDSEVDSTGPRIASSLPLWLATAVGLAMTHILVVSGDADRAWIARYPRYFDVAWKHAVHLALAGAFVVALWILLFIGVALFDLVGIDFYGILLFGILLNGLWIPVTTFVFAVALHVADAQAGIVRGVRTLAPTLLSGLLPLFALIAIGLLACCRSLVSSRCGARGTRPTSS